MIEKHEILASIAYSYRVVANIRQSEEKQVEWKYRNFKEPKKLIFSWKKSSLIQH